MDRQCGTTKCPGADGAFVLRTPLPFPRRGFEPWKLLHAAPDASRIGGNVGTLLGPRESHIAGIEAPEAHYPGGRHADDSRPGSIERDVVFQSRLSALGLQQREAQRQRARSVSCFMLAR